MSYPISFPNLNISFSINPIAISFAGINIYWYGIFITLAVLIGLFFCKKHDGLFKIKFDDVFDFILIALFIGLVFARIYYVIFNYQSFENFIDVFKIWNGGIAIYGGIIGAGLVAIIFSIVKKIKLLDLCDYIIPYLALGQAIGRWGNFINQEAYGYETESFLKMRIYNKQIGAFQNVHPTFLYESILDFLIFLILIFIRRKRKFSGELLSIYLFLYGIGRFIIEGLRTDSLMIGDFRISRIISVISIVISILLYFYVEFCQRKKTTKS